MSFEDQRKNVGATSHTRLLIKIAAVTLVLICMATITVPPVALAIDATERVSKVDQAVAAAEIEAERSQWRYTSQGWRHISELKVKEPAPEWKIDRVHPLLVVMFEILTACLLLIFCSKSTRNNNSSSDHSSEKEGLDNRPPQA